MLFRTPGDLPDPGIELVSPRSPALDSLPLRRLGSLRREEAASLSWPPTPSPRLALWRALPHAVTAACPRSPTIGIGTWSCPQLVLVGGKRKERMVMTKDVSCVPKVCLTFDVSTSAFSCEDCRTQESTWTFRPGNWHVQGHVKVISGVCALSQICLMLASASPGSCNSKGKSPGAPQIWVQNPVLLPAYAPVDGDRCRHFSEPQCPQVPAPWAEAGIQGDLGYKPVSAEHCPA